MISGSILDAVPILLLIGVGVLVRHSGLVDERGALTLTRLAYHVTIPAAIAVSIARSTLVPELFFLPLIAVLLPALLAGIMYLTTRRLKDQPRQRGVLLVAMVVLGVFAFPFMELFFGPAGLARIALYDLGNAFYAGILATYFARHFGGQQPGRGIRLRKVLSSPLLLAALSGVALSLLRVPLTGVLGSLLDRLADANTPLAMMAVGMFLRPNRAQSGLVLQFIAVRMLLGGVLGWGMALLFGLNGLDLIAATVGSSLPAGTTALVLSGAEGLDTGLAAAIVSSSLIAGIVVVNVLPLLLAAIYL
ncbi:MAG: AEC family transporter [Anaerolineae bacterium]